MVSKGYRYAGLKAYLIKRIVELLGYGRFVYIATDKVSKRNRNEKSMPLSRKARQKSLRLPLRSSC